MKKFLLLAVFFITPFFTNAATFVSGDITTDTTWTKAGSPYIINNDDPFIFVNPGVTLTIEPGAIVKFTDYSYIDVRGTLRAIGLIGDKIYFTSLKNDALGGDDNGGSDMILPSAHDRWGVYFENNLTDNLIAFAEFSYSGDSVFVSQSSLTLRDVSFSNVDYGPGVSASRLVLERVNVEHGIREALNGYNGSEITAIDFVVKDIWEGDGIGLYDSELSLTRSSVDGVFDGSALGLYGAHATATDSTFSNALYSGAEIYDSWQNKLSTIYLENCILENNLWSGLSVYGGSSAKVKKSVFRGSDYGLEVYDKNYPANVSSFLSIEQSAIYDNSEY
ncbi:MAG: right-handed parallel beta-helix repeat-containing protein, partial [Patescibacteria group bacterium]